MNREALDKFCERGILAFVLAILIFGPLAMGAVDTPEFLVIQGLTLGVMLLWVLRIWASPKPQLLWPPICWVVLAFAIYAVARYLTADIEYVARLELIQVLMYAFLFFAVVNNLYRQEMAQIIGFTLIFLAMAISAWAVYQFFTHTNRVWHFTSPYMGRASGTYISPNNLAGFLEMLLPLAAAYVLAGRMKPVTRVFLGYAALVMAAGLTVTFSRGGWTAAAIGLLAVLGVLLRHRSHRVPALLLLVVLIGGGAWFTKIYLAKTLAYITRMEGTVSTGQVELDFRRDMWTAAERMWLGHFWWGVGPAHYDYRFREYRPENVQMRPDRAHNDYLNLLADWGAAGGIIVLAGMAFFIIGVAKTWRHVRRSENDFGSGQSNRFAFFLGASAGLLALAVHSVVDFNLHIPANALVGVTLLALLSSNLRFATQHYWLNARLPVRILLTIMLAGVVVYLTGQEWRRGHEARWLARAGGLPDYFSPQRTAALERAFDAEPMNFETADDIGEAYRVESFNGGANYEDLANKAMQWFARAGVLDRYDAYSHLRCGMCLDWLDRHDEAEKQFSQAETLDPNGYYTVAIIGWHYVQIEDYAAARPWFERSLRLEVHENNIARSYLELVEQKLVEKASGKSAFPGHF